MKSNRTNNSCRILLIPFISFVLYLFIATPSFAQAKAKISGKVIDAATNQPLPFASVAVLQQSTNGELLIGGAPTSEAGYFLIDNLPTGQLKVQITYLGYQTQSQVIQIKAGVSELPLGNIAMLAETSVLQEVMVKAEKAQMDMAMNKRTFNVAKNLTTNGGTAESLLRNIPSLTIDANGSATLRNVTTTIYINGKPTQLSLAQIPANQIESVEVMTNPSAKYDASASGGIVNLVLKKNREAGYNGTISASVGTNSRFDGTLSVDYNRGKWNITTLYSVNSTKNPLNNYAYKKNRLADGTPLNYFNQNTIIDLNNVFQNSRIAVDYSYNKKNTIALAGTYVTGQYNQISNQTYTYLDANSIITSSGARTTQPKNDYTNAGVELDWKHDFPQKGRILSITSGYNRNSVSNADAWLTTSFDSNGNSQNGYPINNVIRGRTTGNQVVAQVDYTYPVNDSTKWEVGLRSFTYIRDQQYFFYESTPVEVETLLPSYSQNADISEGVNAIYGLYSAKLKKGLSLEAGLRFEESFLRGLSRFDPATTFGYDYPKSNGDNFIKAFFPSFAITKKLKGESEIGLNLSRKIGRPGWRQFFVGIQSSDRQNITIGNPALQPEFVNTAELNYNKAWNNINLLSTFYYIYEDNTIKPFVQPSVTDPNVLVTTFTNVKADVRLGFDNTLTFSIGKKLSILGNFNGYYVSLQTDTQDRSLWAYNAKVNVTYNFPFNISAQLNTSRSSLFPQLQGYRSPVFAADFALKKSFWNNKASVLFTINDIFDSRKQIAIYDQPTTYQTSLNRREIRFYKITLTLPLNRAASSKKKKDLKIARPDVDFNN
ncbi:MAG: TonB-dependent receptor domain-containing protein [Cyclobacteriaceae bacterium]